MIYLFNAFAFAFASYCWSREDAKNMVVGVMFIALAVVNCALAAPFVSHWLP